MREGSSQSTVRVRVERGIFKRQTRDGATRYEVAYVDSDNKQRWRTVDKLQAARDLRAELVSRLQKTEGRSVLDSVDVNALTDILTGKASHRT